MPLFPSPPLRRQAQVLNPRLVTEATAAVLIDDFRPLHFKHVRVWMALLPTPTPLNVCLIVLAT